MTNLNTLVGFGAGGGDGGGLPTQFTNTAVLVDSSSWEVRPGRTDSSSSTYHGVHALEDDGCYGLLTDAYGGGYTADVAAVGIKVDPSNGSIGTPTVLGGQIYGSGQASGIFSTCHHGAVGNVVMNAGHHQNTGYGTTHKGFCYGAHFNNNAEPQGIAGNTASWANWPHSNGNMPMAMNSSGRAHGRRTTYNTSTSVHRWECFTYSPTQVSNTEDSNANSNTSTNYNNPSARQSRGDKKYNGWAQHYDNAGQPRITAFYGDECTRSSSTQMSSTYLQSGYSFHLSNDHSIWYYNGGCFLHNGTSTAPTKFATNPVNIAILSTLDDPQWNQNTIWPSQDADDVWYCMTKNHGMLKIKIDINDSYKLSILGQWYTNLWGPFGEMSGGSHTFSCVGSNDEYMVFHKYTKGTVITDVYETPTQLLNA